MRISLSLFACLALASATRAQPPSPQQIDVLVKDALAQWNVPGLAVAIVYDDRLIYLKGFGVKELGKPGLVTPDTVFPIASCSKALTVTALAMLVDDGRLDWDDPVRKHLPWFKLADPYANAHVTLRDLLTHRTGLDSHQPLWFRTPWSMEERVRRLGFLKPTFSFRSTFQYQVIAYGAAGLVGGQAAQSSWREMIQQRVLGPLGMTSASAVFPGADNADCASPHKPTAKGVGVVERYPLDHPDPAGSIHASARDLSNFLRLQLIGGTWQGKRLVSQESLFETHTPQVVIRHDAFSRAMHPHTNVLNYTLGWIAQDYRGRWMLMHGGTVDGFRAQLTLVPDHRLGIALLNNLDRTWMNLALSNTLVDRFCRLPAKDWNAHCQAVAKEDLRSKKQHINDLLATRKTGTKPSLPLASYVGAYTDLAYGTCRVRMDKDQLRWDWNNVGSRLDHFHFDTFLAVEEPVETLALMFQLGDQGDVDALRVMERTFQRER